MLLVSIAGSAARRAGHCPPLSIARALLCTRCGGARRGVGCRRLPLAIINHDGGLQRTVGRGRFL
jgi:hypothetical protein